jgi:putative ABC transport system permease protein
VTTAERALDRSLAQERLLFTLLSVFAALAVVLSAVGIYGVVAQFVSQRHSEFAVRVALGAGRGSIVWLVIDQSARPLIAGLAAGIGITIVVGPLVQDLLFGVSVLDPGTIAFCVASLCVVGVLACGLPAWRASRTLAVDALRR